MMKYLTKKLFDKEIDIELFNQTLRSVSELEVPECKPIADFNFLEGLIATVKDDSKTAKAIKKIQDAIAKKVQDAL